jgi:hypothetical protein
LTVSEHYIIVEKLLSWHFTTITLTLVLIREIVETMVTAYSQKIFSGQKPVFDGRKNLYSRDPLPIGRERVSHQFNNGLGFIFYM